MSTSQYYWILFFHLIGASIWVGGHLVLAFGYLPEALKTRSIERLQTFENKFEKIGIPALLIQIITGFFLGFHLSSNWMEWFQPQSPYRGIGLKLLLLLTTFILAVDARLRVIPKLNSENIESLAWHIVPVTVIGVLFVAVGVFFRIGGI